MSYFQNLKPNHNNYEPKGSSVRVKKNSKIINSELYKVDWSNRDKVFDYILVNLTDILHYAGANDKDVLLHFYRPLMYPTIYEILSQNPDIKLTKNSVIDLNNCMYTYIIRGKLDDAIPEDLYRDTLAIIYKISDIINKDMIERLSYLDIYSKNNFLRYIPICRKSSREEFVNITRVNFAIMMNMNPEYTSEEDLKDIYRELFYENEEELFLVSMQDVYNYNEPWFTDSISYMYSIITNTMIELLNEKPMSYIEKVLNKYSDILFAKQFSKDDVRCTLLVLSMDYDKVKYVADKIYASGRYMV